MRLRAVAHIGRLQADGGGGEVALGVVAHHEGLFGGEAEFFERLEVVAGARLAARGVLPRGHQLKGHVEHVAPAHAALDARAREARVGEQRDAQAAVQYCLDGLVRPFARARGDEAVVLLGQDLALVKLDHVEDGGFEQGDSAAALQLIGEELAVGPHVALGALAVVELEHGAAHRGEHRHGALARRLREEVCLVERKNADERVQIDAEQRVVHVEDNRLELRHGRLPFLCDDHIYQLCPKTEMLRPRPAVFRPITSGAHFKLGTVPNLR